MLGPNGAGKSTTMNMICSIVRPTAGEIELPGKNPWKQKKEVIDKIGYEIAEESTSDIFLMDIQMPKMDGIEAAKYIVENNLGKVLILTTSDDDTALAVYYLTGKKQG